MSDLFGHCHFNKHSDPWWSLFSTPGVATISISLGDIVYFSLWKMKAILHSKYEIDFPDFKRDYLLWDYNLLWFCFPFIHNVAVIFICQKYFETHRYWITLKWQLFTNDKMYSLQDVLLKIQNMLTILK